MSSTSTVQSDDQALLIYQQCLDTLATALLSGDMDTLAAGFNLPVQMQTLAATMVVETEDELRAGYSKMSDRIRSDGVTHFFWLASSARFLGPDYIEGFHSTHRLRNAEPLVPPFHSRAVLKRIGDTWKIDEIKAQIQNTSWPIEVPKGVSAPQDPDELTQIVRRDARAGASDPLDVYRQFLDEYSAHNMSGDFEAWSAMHLFPHTVHYDSLDQVVKTPEGDREFFDMLSNMLKEKNVTEFRRDPTHAVFLSGNQICGYHEGTMYSGDVQVFGPVKSRIILQRVGPTWFLRSISNSISNTSYPYKVPRVSDKLVPLSKISSRRRS